MSSKRSLWWYTGATDEGDDVLIFDPGHDSGDLHVYTHKESIRAEDVQEMAEEELGKSHDRPLLAEDLAQLEFGESHGKRYSIED